jgi:glycosyltransferase involved in cell wall biosynthesis
MSITDTENNAVLCSYKCDGGGNQSGKKLAELLGYEFYRLNTDEWKQCTAKKQVWYMNDDIYKLNNEYRREFERVLSYADDIRVCLNFVIGGTDKQKWILDYPVKKIVFLNNARVKEWKEKTAGTRQGLIEVTSLLPPINLELFTGDKEDKERYPDDPVAMYKALDNGQRDFHFMLGHPKLKKAFTDRFHFYEWSEIPVHEYLRRMDVYLAIINPKTKEQAGRANMEAMASACCVITENRDGPKEYIEHGKTGFLVNSEQEAIDIINKLNLKEIRNIGAQAREYALKNFDINKWIKTLK